MYILWRGGGFTSDKLAVVLTMAAIVAVVSVLFFIVSMAKNGLLKKQITFDQWFNQSKYLALFFGVGFIASIISVIILLIMFFGQ